MWLSESGGESIQRVCGETIRQEQRLREKKLLGRRCCELDLKMQKKDVWEQTEKKRERLKDVYIRTKIN